MLRKTIQSRFFTSLSKGDKLLYFLLLRIFEFMLQTKGKHVTFLTFYYEIDNHNQKNLTIAKQIGFFYRDILNNLQNKSMRK